MQLFLRGVVLPFQKGNAWKKKIEHIQPATPVRIPIAGPEDASPTIAGADGSPLSAGQTLCQPEGKLPVLSSVSGQVDGTVVVNHPLYGQMLCAEIRPTTGEEALLPVLPETELTPDKIIELAVAAGIYDELDGTPLAKKLAAWQLPENDPANKRVVLVADATENDIFGSSAWAVLNEEAKLVKFGLQMAAKALHFDYCHIATMLPGKRRRALKKAIGREYVYTVGDEYPVTIFADGAVDVFRVGVQACLALGRALKEGKKHTGAVITVAGDGLAAARNLYVPFGTDLSDLLAICGYQPDATVIMGDAMTGISCENAHLPLLPGMTTLLALAPRPVRLPGPCIGCGRCAAVCHAELLPYEIVRRLENMHYERLRHLSATECDGCAACSYVCPANRPVADEVLRARETNGTVFLNWGDEEDE